jgi:hypothetical protein
MFAIKSSHLRRLDKLYRVCLMPFVPLLALLPPARAGRLFAASQVLRTRAIALLFNKIAPRDGGAELQFLHVGKAAGNSIKFAFDKAGNSPDSPLPAPADGGANDPRRRQIRAWGHKYKLDYFAPGADYVVNLRDPVSRYHSGFYSRKRMGRPKKDVPHSFFEGIAFRLFPHANELAEALSDRSFLRRCKAVFAMTTITHVGDPLSSWFSLARVQSHPPFAVLQMERLGPCMQALARKLGQPDFELPADKVDSHANNYSDTPPLSAAARENLVQWYATDYRIYRHLTEDLAVEAAPAARPAADGSLPS